MDKASLSTFIIIIISLFIGLLKSENHDKSLKTGATGEEVVRRTLDVLLRKCLITPREDRFLLRLAHAVSDYGTRNSSTNMSSGGIWKIDEEHFNTTKSDDFYEMMARDIHRINSTLKIDWTKTHLTHLDIPLYSALAAKVFARFQNSLHDEHLPPSVGQQANYAFRHFKAPGNQADFIIASEKLDPKCPKALDLVFVFESTKEMKMVNFHRAKELIKETIKHFVIHKNSTRVGVVTLAGSPYIHARLADEHTDETLTKTVDRIIYSGGRRENGFSVSLLQEMFLQKNGARQPGSFHPKVLAVVLPPDVEDDNEIELLKEHMRNNDISVVKVRMEDHPMNMDIDKSMMSEETTAEYMVGKNGRMKKCKPELMVKPTSYLPNIAVLLAEEICQAPVYLPPRDHFGPTAGEISPKQYDDFVVRVTKLGTSVEIRGSRSAAMLYMTSTQQRPISVNNEIHIEVYPYRKTLVFLRHPAPDAPKDVDVHFSVFSQGALPTKLTLVVSAGAKDMCHSQPCPGDKVCTLEGTMRKCWPNVAKFRKKRGNRRAQLKCKREVSPWSECSLSCAMGVSTRAVVDPKTCLKVLQKRSCYLRPCDLQQQTGQKCRPTRRMPRTKVSLQDGCWSVESFRLKICNSCSDMCCLPKRNRTIRAQVTCQDGTTHYEPFMKIRSCECHDGPC